LTVAHIWLYSSVLQPPGLLSRGASLVDARQVWLRRPLLRSSEDSVSRV